MWVQLAILIISIIVTVATRPHAKGNQAAAATMDDFDIPQAKEGTPQMIIFGDCWCTDWTVIGMGNFRSSPIRSGGGGK